jgi:outer membrane protein OmpA-like peptidoglycan-associated protein
VAGPVRNNGCPILDTDKDGINDEKDKCPTVAGLARYDGCPVPDTDKDGLNDEQDKCPTVAGLAKYDGCPIPDADGDGVNDEEDRCPTLAGTAANYGCPSIDFNAANIQFATGTSNLTTAAKTELNKLSEILNRDYMNIKIAIEGHTDNVGKAEINQSLSEKRAAAVKAYLIGKKVDAARLSSVGYGPAQPVADNATAEGRAKNRRVEFKVSE